MLTFLAITSYFRSHHFNLECWSSNFWWVIMALEDRFRAAIRVIQSLPKDGPYQPSNSTKLRFYSLFKQATEGKCPEGRPNVFNIIGRAKWDSWNKLGDMDMDDAKKEYIEELKKIIETMSFSGDVQEFLDSIGPFYEFVNLEGAEFNHIKEALDHWTSSSSSLSNSSTSSPNCSPVKSPLENQEATDEKDEMLQNKIFTETPIVKKLNGYLPNEVQVDSIISTSSSSSFTAPQAPVHRALQNISKNSLELSNGHTENNSVDEILQIDEVSHEYQIHSSHEKVYIDSLQSGTESDKYYSGDSEPEIDIDEKLSSSVSCMAPLDEPHSLHIPLSRNNGIGQGPKNRVRQKVGSHQNKEGVEVFVPNCGNILEAHQRPEFILQNTVEHLNRDVDHILARLRILEAAYASNGHMSGNGQGSQLRRKRFFGELSANSLTLIFTWPFIAYFIIKLLKWWFTRRSRSD